LFTVRRCVYVLFAILAVGSLGCDENTPPEGPDAPPQINLVTISGMPSDDVYDVFVDRINNLWVATEQGLLWFLDAQAASFDVKTAVWITNRDGIPNLRCRCVAELHDKIFVGTWGGGIGICSDLGMSGIWEAVGPSEGLPATRIVALAADDSSMWIATVEGVYQYIDDPRLPVEDRVIDHSGIGEFGAGVFSSILVYESDTWGPEVWTTENRRDVFGIFVPGGIKVLRSPETQYFRTATSGIPSDDVNDIAFDDQRGVFWSAHALNGIASLDVDTKTWTHIGTGDGLVSDLASSVAVNNLATPWPKGTVWVATQNGLTKMEPDGDMVNYTDGSGLPNLRVRKVVVDKNNNVWLGFVERGAARVSP